MGSGGLLVGLLNIHATGKSLCKMNLEMKFATLGV